MNPSISLGNEDPVLASLAPSIFAFQNIMPTLLALAGATGSDTHPFDGKDAWATLSNGKPSPHEDILINVEVYRGAIRKGNWKLVKTALLPGKTELFDLASDIGEKKNAATAKATRPKGSRTFMASPAR